jgi:transmembrane sensor
MEEKLAKYFSGEATEEERKEMHHWRSSSESNSVSFLKAKNIWVNSSLEVDVNQSMLAGILKEKDAYEGKVIPLWSNNFMKIAASILIVLGLSFVLFQSTDNTKEVVANQDTIDQVLPDGSIVTLHKGASLVIGDFEQTRNVQLSGKAYFNIKREETKPFIIRSKNARVEVLGTSFVVDTESENEVEVLVESGLVAFSNINETASVRLSKGEMGALDNSLGVISKKRIEDQNYLAWKTKALVFDGASLQQVAKVINDVYDLEVIFKNEDLLKCKLNGQYLNKSSKEVIEIIAQTFGITPEWRNNKVTFDGIGCI